MASEKMCKVMDLAAEDRLPVIGINDSGGRAHPGGRRLARRLGDVFLRERVKCSGVIPQISLIRHGAPGGAVLAAITDFIFMVRRPLTCSSRVPDVIKTVTGEEPTFEELGGAMTHNSKSGVAHFASSDEDECLEDARYLLASAVEQPRAAAVTVHPTD